VAQLLKENRPGKKPRARRFALSSGNRMMIMYGLETADGLVSIVRTDTCSTCPEACSKLLGRGVSPSRLSALDALHLAGPSHWRESHPVNMTFCCTDRCLPVGCVVVVSQIRQEYNSTVKFRVAA
jgi:hypothetical protein